MSNGMDGMGGFNSFGMNNGFNPGHNTNSFGVQGMNGMGGFGNLFYHYYFFK
jgi:hypothetical protein